MWGKWPPCEYLLCLSSGSASFEGAFEGQLCHNAAWRLSQSEGSSRCSFFSLFLEDAPLRSFVASHIPRFFVLPKKKKEREKMASSRGVDRHRNRHVRVKHLVTQPGNAPEMADEVNKVSEGLAFTDHKGRVLQRRPTLNWDSATVCCPSYPSESSVSSPPEHDVMKKMSSSWSTGEHEQAAGYKYWCHLTGLLGFEVLRVFQGRLAAMWRRWCAKFVGYSLKDSPLLTGSGRWCEVWWILAAWVTATVWHWRLVMLAVIQK